MANKLFKLKILSILLFTALGATLASCSSSSEKEQQEEIEEIEEFIDLNDHTHDGWVSLSQSDFDSGTYSSGNLTGGTTEDEMTYYYLSQDITLSTNDITISDYVTLCLNSYTLTGTSNTQVINIADSAYFNLCECNSESEGTITNGTISGIYVSNSATFNLYGGSITENSCSSINFGGGVNVDNATFNMYGGSISNNDAERYAAGVYVNGSDAIFNMYDGTISNNTATYGGAAAIANGGTFNMYGGSISYNEAYCGGAVYIFSSQSFYMYGGTINNNTATAYSSYGGGAVYLSSQSTFYMYGGTISENTANYRGSAVHLYLDSSTFYMYGGTITDNDSIYGIYSLYTATFYMYDGYLNDGISLSIYAPSYIYGGYFSTSAYSSARSYVGSDRVRVDISLLGTEFDENYIEGYPNAIYTSNSLSTEVISIDASYGSLYTLDITDEYTSVGYTIDVNGETQSLVLENYPTYLGTYTITAHVLLESTNDDITTKYYGTRTISLNILKGQAKITLNSISKVYDGEEASIDYIATVGDLDITDISDVRWFDENNNEIDAPVDVGTYKATISIDDTATYDGTSINVNYTITN